MALTCSSMQHMKKKLTIARSATLMKSAVSVLLTSAVLLLPTVRAEDSVEESSSKNGAQLSKGEIKAQQQFKMLDFNQDGKLSRKEVAIIPKLAAAFDETDTNKDGFVSYEEVRAFAVKYRAQRDKDKAAQASAAQAAAGNAAPESAHKSEASSADAEIK